MAVQTPAFNLVDEPWIPCLHPDGRVEELGLRNALARAHEFRGVVGESPPVTAALYRLLLAMLHRMVEGPRTEDDWADLWRAGRWDRGQVDAYLNRWRDRFYLFHPERPFYQWRVKMSKEKPIATLLPDMATGNNATLFSHNLDTTDNPFPPARAARTLLFVQTASFAGGSGLAPKDSSDAPWGRGIIFLVEGDNLFETLVLNLLPYTEEEPIPGTRDDHPIWESDNPLHPPRSLPLGYVDYLTWPSRSVWLVPEQEGDGIVVRTMLMGSGLKLEGTHLDPFKHYRVDKKRGYRDLRFKEGRAVWRDSASLLELKAAEKGRPPLTLFWLAELVADGVLDRARTYRYMALGMCNNQAKVDFYREEHLPLPAAYLQDEGLVEHLRTGLEAAQNVRRELMRAVSRLANLFLSPTADDKEGHRPDPKDVNNLMAHWAVERHYWAALEVPFLDFLQTLPHDPEKSQERWTQVLVQTARDSLAQAENLAGTGTRALRAAVRARGQLEGRLTKVFP